MEPRGFDLKRRNSRDTMTSVVNRGVLTVFGCDFSPIPWGNCGSLRVCYPIQPISCCFRLSTFVFTSTTISHKLVCAALQKLLAYLLFASLTNKLLLAFRQRSICSALFRWNVQCRLQSLRSWISCTWKMCWRRHFLSPICIWSRLPPNIPNDHSWRQPTSHQSHHCTPDHPQVTTHRR